MWKHNPGLRTLDNKDGNWMYMQEHWTLPLKEEKEKVYIETLKGCVLELNNEDQTVLLINVTDSSSKLVKIMMERRLYSHLLCLLSDPSQLWKLEGDGRVLGNKANFPILDKEWSITSKRKDGFNIENVSNKSLVLGITSYGTVIEEEFVDGKPGQLWKKGKPDAEGYFSLEVSKSSKLLTANSSSNLEVLGNYLMRISFHFC